MKASTPERTKHEKRLRLRPTTLPRLADARLSCRSRGGFGRKAMCWLGRESLRNHRSRNPGSSGSQLLLSPQALGGSHIPLQICPFLLPPPPLGPLGFQKSRKSKRGKEKSSSLLNRVQGWMCPASQQARQGKQGLRLTQQAANSSTPAAQPGPQPAGAPSPRPSSRQPPPLRRRGRDEALRRLLVTSCVASFVCLIPQQSLSLKLTLIAVQGPPPKSKPRSNRSRRARQADPHPSRARTHSTGVWRVSSRELMAHPAPVDGELSPQPAFNSSTSSPSAQPAINQLQNKKKAIPGGGVPRKEGIAEGGREGWRERGREEKQAGELGKLHSTSVRPGWAGTARLRPPAGLGRWSRGSRLLLASLLAVALTRSR
ncbi:hypothetical protein HPG69_001680 [Diceros bicornis minor]|uniref:Uncharacterized protein n=1 Tax=Diceros bicornis minor TaxID=77932 RepID=A0A7J7FC10_DICBM|nr:hypothetical protein HPG69_001680 [Diceros bicornis minor]